MTVSFVTSLVLYFASSNPILPSFFLNTHLQQTNFLSLVNLTKFHVHFYNMILSHLAWLSSLYLI